MSTYCLLVADAFVEIACKDGGVRNGKAEEREGKEEEAA
jgi:hypothetical protein